METVLYLADVTCPRCSERIEVALSRLAGVQQAVVDWRSGEARVRHAPTVSSAALIATIESASTGTRHRYRVTAVQHIATAIE